MAIPKAPLLAVFLQFASRLRFKQLFYLTGGLFVLDMLVPDLIPFVDELILGLLTLLLASWKKAEEPDRAETEIKTIEGKVVANKHSDRDSP